MYSDGKNLAYPEYFGKNAGIPFGLWHESLCDSMIALIRVFLPSNIGSVFWGSYKSICLRVCLPKISSLLKWFLPNDFNLDYLSWGLQIHCCHLSVPNSRQGPKQRQYFSFVHLTTSFWSDSRHLQFFGKLLGCYQRLYKHAQILSLDRNCHCEAWSFHHFRSHADIWAVARLDDRCSEFWMIFSPGSCMPKYRGQSFLRNGRPSGWFLTLGTRRTWLKMRQLVWRSRQDESYYCKCTWGLWVLHPEHRVYKSFSTNALESDLCNLNKQLNLYLAVSVAMMLDNAQGLRS